MKKNKLLLTLSLCAMLGLTSTAFASVNTNNKTGKQPPKITESNKDRAKNMKSQNCDGLRKVTGKNGRDFLISVIKEKLKVTDEEINKALNEGTSLKKFANDKGLSDEDLKKALIDSKIKAIDESVSKGNLTKEEGEKLKNKIKENSKNCTLGANFKKGKMHNGKGKKGSCHLNGKCKNITPKSTVQ